MSVYRPSLNPAACAIFLGMVYSLLPFGSTAMSLINMNELWDGQKVRRRYKESSNLKADDLYKTKVENCIHYRMSVALCLIMACSIIFCHICGICCSLNNLPCMVHALLLFLYVLLFHIPVGNGIISICDSGN